MERNIRLLALFNFFTDLKFHSAILILYFAQVTGSFALAMSIFSVAQISSAIFEIPTGIFSDYLGRKKTLLLGAAFASGSAVLYAIGGNYWMLFWGAVVEGVSRSWYSGNNDALLHDSLKSLGRKEFFGEYLGRVSAFFQLALAIGAFVGSIMASRSFAVVMWISVIPQILCFAVGFFIREPSAVSRSSGNIFSHLKGSAAFIWKHKILRLLSLQDMLAFGINETTFQFRAVFIATLWPIWAIGISKMLSFFGALISFWFAGRVVKRFGAFRTLFVSRTYGRIVYLTALLYPTVVSPVLMSLTSLLYGVTQVATNSAMQKEFTDSQRATMSSVNSLAGSIVFGLASVAVGLLADKYNATNALIIAEIFSFSLVYITWRLYKIKPA